MFLFFKKNKPQKQDSEAEYLKKCSDDELRDALDIENYFCYEFKKSKNNFKNGLLSTCALAMGLIYVTASDNILKDMILENQPREVITSVCKTFYIVAGIFGVLSTVNGIYLAHAHMCVNKHQKTKQLIEQEINNRQQNING